MSITVTFLIFLRKISFNDEGKLHLYLCYYGSSSHRSSESQDRHCPDKWNKKYVNIGCINTSKSSCMVKHDPIIEPVYILKTMQNNHYRNNIHLQHFFLSVFVLQFSWNLFTSNYCTCPFLLFRRFNRFKSDLHHNYPVLFTSGSVANGVSQGTAMVRSENY